MDERAERGARRDKREWHEKNLAVVMKKKTESEVRRFVSCIFSFSVDREGGTLARARARRRSSRVEARSVSDSFASS
jgi:hypothetical protein